MKLEREKIVDAALALLNEVGLDRLTTRKLAERLGVQQPALYWHFRNKNALLDAMNEEILRRGHTRRTPLPGEGWSAFILEHARSFRRALLAYRDGARVHAGNEPPDSELPYSDAQLRCLVDAGFEPRFAIRAMVTLGIYVVGSVLEEQATAERQTEIDRFMDRINAYPLLAEAILAQVDDGFDAAFETGLALIVAGLEGELRGQKKAGRATARRTAR